MKLSHQGKLRQAIYGSLLLGTAGSAALTGLPAYAADDAGDKSVQLQGVSVTGSRIRRVESEGPTPVEVISSQQITQSGFSNIQQLFDNLSLNVGGSLGRNQTFGFTPGASGVDLRGFGVGRTLVLVDGRRLPVYPIAAGGSDNFVDLSSIPAAVVDRIEILTTGGSAIYGSDAISGVINIITKKRLKGFEGSVRVGGTEHGGYSNQRYQLAYGFSTPTDSLIISGEMFHNDPLNASQRYYSKLDTAPGLGIIGRFSSYGASFLDFENLIVTPSTPCNDSNPIGTGFVIRTPNPDYLPGVPIPNGTTCGYNRASQRQLFPSTDQNSLFAKFEHKFEWATAYVNASYNNTYTQTRQEAFPYYSPLIPTGAPNSATGGFGYFYRRLLEYGGRGSNTDNLTTAALVGLKGSVGAYDWDVGLSRSQVRSNNNYQSIIKSNLDRFVCGGSIDNGVCTYANGPGLDLLAPIPADVVLASSYQRTAHAISQLTTVDASVNGPVPGLVLPGGAVQVAAFATYQRAYYSNLNDPITQSGQGVDGSVDAQGNRSYSAYALELSFPITNKLSLNTAGRYDIYNTNAGSQFTAQGALQYRPFKELLLRSSVGSTFRAPDLQRTFGGTTTANESAIDSPTCIAQGGTVGDPNSPAVCTDPVQSIPVSSTGNPQLKSEKGTNYSFGFVVEPIKRMTFSIDYYYIQLRNAVQSPTAQYILNQCANNGVLCNKITRDLNGSLNRGLIVTDPLNTAGQKQKGFDAKLDYIYSDAMFGRIQSTSSFTYQFSSRYQITVDSPDSQQLGYLSVPRYRLNSQLDWQKDSYGASITYLLVPKMPGANASDPATKDQYLEAFDQVNVQVRYLLGKWGTIRAGLNNVFDSHPPFDRTDDNSQFITGVALSFSNTLGREGFLQYEFKF